MISYISNQLNRMPVVKKVIKRAYQLGMYGISPKIRFQGDIHRLSPDDSFEYFFGYYDKTPWNANDNAIVFLRCRETHRDAAPLEPAEIVMLDTKTNTYTILGRTNAWNVQQGCMLQWLKPDDANTVLYNDFRQGKYCAVVLNACSRQERVLPMPVYCVSNDGSNALTLDFSRLHRLRKGYGYANIGDATRDQKCPDAPCIWKMDIASGEVAPLLRYTDLARFEPRPEMENAVHKVNHLMISPNGKRFMVLHRWLRGGRKWTRLLTCDMDGNGLFNLLDDDMVSHCCWKDDRYIVAYANKAGHGAGYYLLTDRTSDWVRIWPSLTMDGHPSFSPDGRYAVTDTYPNKARMATVFVIEDGEIHTLARVHVPFRYDNDTRCDLHPRWQRDGKKVCFDAVFEGRRGLYQVDVQLGDRP